MSIDKSQRFVPFQMFCRPEVPQGRESFRSMSCRWSQAGAGHKLTDTVLDVKLWWAQVIQGSRLSALRPHRPLFLLGRRCRCSCSWVKAGLGMIETDKSIWTKLEARDDATAYTEWMVRVLCCQLSWLLSYMFGFEFWLGSFRLEVSECQRDHSTTLFRSQCCQCVMVLLIAGTFGSTSGFWLALQFVNQ